MRSTVAAHKFDREKWTAELSPFLNLWKKLNQVSNSAVRDCYDDVYAQDDLLHLNDGFSNSWSWF